MRIEIKNLHKFFGDREVLKGVSFAAESGRALGLLGRNGAGKTTSIRIIMDIFRADEGEVLLDGEKFVPGSYQVGYLPEERGMYPKKKVLEQMIYFGKLRGMDKKSAVSSSERWLERLEVGEYANREMSTLSKGNQQKVQLAATLVGNPDIIVLDEPFSGLDPVNAQILKDVVRELIKEEKIVIFSSHQMGYVEEFCEDIAILRGGEIVLAGDLSEIQKERGKGRKVLALRGMEQTEVLSFCENEMGDVLNIAGRTKEGAVVEPKADGDFWQILDRLRERQIDIENYSDYRPSLNDIFVECAGDDTLGAGGEDAK